MGIQLPDIEFKVKANTAEMDVAAAKAKVLGDSIDRNLQPAGQAFVKFGKDGELASLRISSATAKTQGDLDRLAERARLAGRSLGKDLGEGVSAVIKLGEDGSAEMSRLGNSIKQVTDTGHNSIPVLGGIADAAGMMASRLGAVVIAVVALGVALSPVITLLGAFAAGLTASLAVITVGLGAIVGLGAAIVLLGQRVQGASAANQQAVAAQKQLTDATNEHQIAVKQLETLQANLKGHKATADQLQLLADLQQQVAKTSYDMVAAQNAVAAAGKVAVTPMQQFTDHVGKLLDQLGNQAAPMVAPILHLLTGVVDGFASFGSRLISMFGDRLPSMLHLFDEFSTTLLSGFNKLIPVIASFLDAFTARGPKLNDILNKLVDGGIDAIDGLLTNLLRLSDWFTKELPTLGPPVAQIMSGIGSTIQGVGVVAAGLVDFFVQHWPQISSAAQQAWDAIKAGWNAAAPVLQAEMPAALTILAGLMGFLRDHSDLVRVGFVAVGFSAAALVGSIVAIGAAVTGILAGLQFLYEKFIAITGAITGAINRVYELAGGLRTVASLMSGGIGGAAGNALHSFGIPGFASGGVAMPGTFFTSGEQGPELGYAMPGGGVAIAPSGGSVSVSNMASTRRIERQLDQQTALLAQIAASSSAPMFSNRAYGS